MILKNICGISSGNLESKKRLAIPRIKAMKLPLPRNGGPHNSFNWTALMMALTKDRKIIDIGLSFDNTYLKLDNKLSSRILPAVPKDPKLVIYNEDLGEYLGIRKINELTEVLGGKYLPLGAEPIALAYGGHQFGYFNILGDGRANLLGEFINNIAIIPQANE